MTEVAPSQAMLESVRGHTKTQLDRVVDLAFEILVIRILACQALQEGYGRAEVASMQYHQRHVSAMVWQMVQTNRDITQLIRFM